MQAKKVLCGLLIASYTMAATVSADEVVGRSPDQTEGQAIGGATALLVGGAIAGSFGALCAGIVGVWSGGKIQESLGLSGERYHVRKENGALVDRRSPNYTFNIGEKVKLENGRVRPLNADQAAQ